MKWDRLNFDERSKSGVLSGIAGKGALSEND
jgi:hypothetical protein